MARVRRLAGKAGKTTSRNTPSQAGINGPGVTSIPRAHCHHANAGKPPLFLSPLQSNREKPSGLLNKIRCHKGIGVERGRVARVARRFEAQTRNESHSRNAGKSVNGPFSVFSPLRHSVF